MHSWKPWIVLATLAAFAGQAAVVYKWTDSEGVVHYSDQPVPGAEKIYTATSTTAGTASAGHSTADSQEPGAKKEPPGLGLTEFSITSPAQDQTFFGDEPINVNLALTPGLKRDQIITWHLNGKQLDDQGPTTTQFSLPHLDRGTYAIAATITDQTTGESFSTNSVSFFVRQPSALSPQHRTP
jgi:Domain of unknown function (DUF4124)